MQKLSPLIIASLVMVAVTVGVQAQTPSTTSPRAVNPPPISPQAINLLKQSADYLKQQPSYEFDAEIALEDVMVPDFKVQYQAHSKTWVNRPNQVRVDYGGDRRDVNFYYNGKTFTMLDKRANVFSTIPAPATIDATLSQVQSSYDVTLPLTDLLVSDPYTALASQIKTAYYLGKSTVAGVLTHHLALSQNNIDWQIWIQDGKQPLLRKLLITYKNLPGSPQYSAVFSKWKFKPVETSVFSFTPPAKAVPIEFIPISTQSRR